ncbi:hypothetical protein DPMN_001011 [Dreissena polymorpha]|uniref:Uncharacterized protein n=1 Tax=Dreissena polymorpha TaxID=45954 RepID=A0A9D4RQH2_DREPO|nr:hypothetical protein DPMN_001011 [Dreissena polymorpha]
MSKSGDHITEDILSYELSSNPPSLFQAKNILRKVDTPQIIQSMRDQAVNISSEAVINCIPESDCYVLDGCSLFHRLQWKKGDTNNAIALSYKDLRTSNSGVGW